MHAAHDTHRHDHDHSHHGHDHGHSHPHSHHPHSHSAHGHGHADHDHPVVVRPAASSPSGFGSLLLLSAGERLVMAVAVLAALWGATLWVLA